ncbi:hypothetical protein ISCGN_009760 [Ixodes scapularis]
MKATLALLLSLCLVLVDVSFGTDHGNTKKCERLLPRLTNLLCVYKCKGIDLTFEKEDDGTACSFFIFEGKCKNGKCVTESSRISALSMEPTEEFDEPTEESPEPTEESPVQAEEAPDRVTYFPPGTDHGNTKKCERLLPRLTNLLCVYKCKGIDLTFEKEDDGTACSFFIFEGKCKNGKCVTESSRISALSMEPTEEFDEPTEESPEPTEESPVQAEEAPDRVTYFPPGK